MIVGRKRASRKVRGGRKVASRKRASRKVRGGRKTRRVGHKVSRRRLGGQDWNQAMAGWTIGNGDV